MYNSRRLGRNLSKRMHMRHNIMPPLLLLDPGNLKVLIRDHKMIPHLLQRLIADILNPKLLLRLGKIQPELAPRAVSRPLAKQLRHLLGAVAPCERCLVRIEYGRADFRLHVGNLALEVQRCVSVYRHGGRGVVLVVG
jgi:hypothetical protein